MAYKTVIFDLGRVLVHFDFQRGYQLLEGICPHPAADIPKLIAPTGLVELLETGRIDPREFVSRISNLLHMSVDYDRFCAIWNHIFTDPLIPEEMLEGIAARYRMLLLSNTNVIHFEMIREHYPFLRHFHGLVLSYEVHAMKPAPEIYQAALELAGSRPEECFYTDDIPAYVEAARRMGIDAETFHGVAELEGQLAARGMEWGR